MFFSDGSGRSGALAALMYCIERVKLEGVVDVFQVVRSMRSHRVSLVQSLVSFFSVLFLFSLNFHLLVDPRTGLVRGRPERRRHRSSATHETFDKINNSKTGKCLWQVNWTRQLWCFVVNLTLCVTGLTSLSGSPSLILIFCVCF